MEDMKPPVCFPSLHSRAHYRWDRIFALELPVQRHELMGL
jgi:hypothetical protein